MQYKQENEKVDMTGGNYVPVANPMPLAEEPQIKKTRKTFITINGILLGLSIFALISTLFRSASSDSSGKDQRGVQLGQGVISILYYGFGILVAHKYHRTGLRVYAILDIISLILFAILTVALLCIGGAALVVSAYVNPNDYNTINIAMGASAAFIVIGICYMFAVAILVILIILAFKLARLLDAHPRSDGQHI